MYEKFSHTKQLDDTGKSIFLSKNENSVNMYINTYQQYDM